MASRTVRDTPRNPNVIGMPKVAFGVVFRELIDREDELLFGVVVRVAWLTTKCQNRQCSVDLNRIRKVFEVEKDTSAKAADGRQAGLVERRVGPDNQDPVGQR